MISRLWLFYYLTFWYHKFNVFYLDNKKKNRHVVLFSTPVRSCSHKMMFYSIFPDSVLAQRVVDKCLCLMRNSKKKKSKKNQKKNQLHWFPAQDRVADKKHTFLIHAWLVPVPWQSSSDVSVVRDFMGHKALCGTKSLQHHHYTNNVNNNISNYDNNQQCADSGSAASAQLRRQQLLRLGGTFDGGHAARGTSLLVSYVSHGGLDQ